MPIRIAPDRGTISDLPSGRTMMLTFDIRPALVDIRPGGAVADVMNGNRTKPSAVALALAPAACKHVVLAVGPLNDLAVLITPLPDGGVFQTVLRIPRENVGSTPGVRRRMALNRSRQKIIDESFVRGRAWLVRANYIKPGACGWRSS